MVVRIGTSGWQYRDWRGPFYPPRLAQRAWLEHYATGFDTVESNAAFYRLPERRTFEAWAERTPPDFTMAVKASRYLTHVRRLRDPEEAVDRLVGRARGLGSKLGPVLVQLPPRFRADAERLDRTLASFPAGWRVAVEVRDPSWEHEEIRAVLPFTQTSKRPRMPGQTRRDRVVAGVYQSARRYRPLVITSQRLLVLEGGRGAVPRGILADFPRDEIGLGEVTPVSYWTVRFTLDLPGIGLVPFEAGRKERDEALRIGELLGVP